MNLESLSSISEFCREKARPLLLPVVRWFELMGLSPNDVTLFGLLCYALCGVAIASGHLFTAASIIVVFGPLDVIDGMLARETGRVSRFGAFLDSVTDRYAEFFVFLGILAYAILHRNAGLAGSMMVLMAWTGSFMVSYVRARAESLGYSCKVGFFTRFERMVMIVFILATGWLYEGLLILAVCTHFTAFQRIMHVFHHASGSGNPAEREE